MPQETVALETLLNIKEFRERLAEGADITRNTGKETGFVVWYADERAASLIKDEDILLIRQKEDVCF